MAQLTVKVSENGEEFQDCLVYISVNGEEFQALDESNLNIISQ